MVLVPRVPVALLVRANRAAGAIRSRRSAAGQVLQAVARSVTAEQAAILRFLAVGKLAAECSADGRALVVGGKRYEVTARELLEAAAQAPLRLKKSMTINDVAFDPKQLVSIAIATAPFSAFENASVRLETIEVRPSPPAS
jgi:prephenate dehydratase